MSYFKYPFGREAEYLATLIDTGEASDWDPPRATPVVIPIEDLAQAIEGWFLTGAEPRVVLCNHTTYAKARSKFGEGFEPKREVIGRGGVMGVFQGVAVVQTKALKSTSMWIIGVQPSHTDWFKQEIKL